MGNATSDLTNTVHEKFSSGIQGLLETFLKKPDETNETMQAIRANFDKQLKQERQKIHAEVQQQFKEREDSARQREQATLAAAQKTLEDAIRARDEAAKSVAKQLEESARQREEATLMKAKQIEAAARMREEAATAAKECSEAALLAAKRSEEAARMREEAASVAAEERVAAALLAVQQVEATARAREEAALAEAAKAKEDLHKGIRPVVMPTSEQVAAARERMQLNPEKLHFAVCGSSGSGKSTIINAVRGLGSTGEGTAQVGVTECTSEVNRYPDPRKELPYSRFVWYDIPGAGTTAVPDWQYFNDQGLFVFDFIIMVYDIRFTKIDVGIIENCLRFNIPVFIVRSKADQHIQNMIKAETGYEPGDEGYDQVYQEKVDSYVKATRSDFYKHMETMADNIDIDRRDQQLIDKLRVHIVSAHTLQGLLQKTTPRVKKGKVIDETELIEDMLRAARIRRYRNTPGETLNNLFKKGKEVISAGLSSLSLNISTEKPKENSDAKRGGVVDPRPYKIIEEPDRVLQECIEDNSTN